MGCEEADKLMKQADKHCNPSFFSMRIKGDWEQATPLYERAAKLYKVSTRFSFAKHSGHNYTSSIAALLYIVSNSLL